MSIWDRLIVIGHNYNPSTGMSEGEGKPYFLGVDLDSGHYIIKTSEIHGEDGNRRPLRVLKMEARGSDAVYAEEDERPAILEQAMRAAERKFPQFFPEKA